MLSNFDVKLSCNVFNYSIFIIYNYWVNVKLICNFVSLYALLHHKNEKKKIGQNFLGAKEVLNTSTLNIIVLILQIIF